MSQYIDGLGAVLQQAGGSMASNFSLSRSSRAAPAESSGSVTQGMSFIRQSMAQQRQQSGGSVRPTVIDTYRFKMSHWRPSKPGGINLVMDPGQASGLKQQTGPASRVGGGSAGGGAGGAGAPPAGGGSMPSSPDAFAQACKDQLGGTVIGPNICQAPDGAQISASPDGQAVCVNNVGQCAKGGGAKGGAMMIGAAALAALMFLR